MCRRNRPSGRPVDPSFYGTDRLAPGRSAGSLITEEPRPSRYDIDIKPSPPRVLAPVGQREVVHLLAKARANRLVNTDDITQEDSGQAHTAEKSLVLCNRIETETQNPTGQF